MKKEDRWTLLYAPIACMQARCTNTLCILYLLILYVRIRSIPVQNMHELNKTFIIWLLVYLLFFSSAVLAFRYVSVYLTSELVALATCLYPLCIHFPHL